MFPNVMCTSPVYDTYIPLIRGAPPPENPHKSPTNHKRRQPHTHAPALIKMGGGAVLPTKVYRHTELALAAQKKRRYNYAP